MKCKIIIPLKNEEIAITKVLDEIPKKYLKHVIVVSNGSTDKTTEVARKRGVTVLETTSGYGQACLVGIDYCKQFNLDYVVFMDGKYTDDPKDISMFLKKLKEGYDFVVGSRVKSDYGYTHQKFGNSLSVFLIKLFWSYSFTDLGPFRAIRFQKLLDLDMQDKNYGWTAEMQVKVAKHKLSYCEIPVRQRKRIGKSQISGTFLGTIKAGSKILYVIFKELFRYKV